MENRVDDIMAKMRMRFALGESMSLASFRNVLESLPEFQESNGDKWAPISKCPDLPKKQESELMKQVRSTLNGYYMGNKIEEVLELIRADEFKRHSK